MIDDTLLKKAQLMLSRAKIAMFQAHPFYAHILTHLHFELTEDTPYNAISATDGVRVLIHPGQYLALDKDQQLSILIHEQGHCLDGHLWRCGSRDPFYSNVAQDIYLYHLLKAEKFAVLRDNERALSQILAEVAGGKFTLNDFAHNFWEQTYDIIAPAAPPGHDDGAGACGHCYMPPAEARESAEQWKQWVREAAIYAKMVGKAAGRWQEFVEAATPKVPFEARFTEYLKRGLGGDQTFDSFARRHIHSGFYLPVEFIEIMGETVAVVDTSGSRSTDDIAYALGVCREWRVQHPCKFHLVECDAGTQGWTTYEEWEDLPSSFTMHGRGGTSFGPPFIEVEKRGLDPSLLIFITDGYNQGGFAPKPPYPVIWVLSGEYNDTFSPPYGEVCKVR